MTIQNGYCWPEKKRRMTASMQAGGKIEPGVRAADATMSCHWRAQVCLFVRSCPRLLNAVARKVTAPEIGDPVRRVDTQFSGLRTSLRTDNCWLRWVIGDQPIVPVGNVNGQSVFPGDRFLRRPVRLLPHRRQAVRNCHGPPPDMTDPFENLENRRDPAEPCRSLRRCRRGEPGLRSTCRRAFRSPVHSRVC